MVIYANQTMRVAHAAMTRLLKKLSVVDSMSEIQDEMSSMEDIFTLQEMYELKSKEKELQEKLKQLGYEN